MSEINQETAHPDAQGAESTEAPARRYSRGLKETQRLERKITKAQKRLVRAVLSGVESWEKNRDASASKKKDGAVKDAVKNLAKAQSKVLRELSRTPTDIADIVGSIRPKRVLRVLFPLARW